MKHLFVPYELALKLKEKGFDEPCLAYWSTYNKSIPELVINEQSKGNWSLKEDYCTAPLYQQVVDWFLKKHDLYIEPNFGGPHSYPQWWDWIITGKQFENPIVAGEDESYPTRQEALNKAIEKALKLIP